METTSELNTLLDGGQFQEMKLTERAKPLRQADTRNEVYCTQENERPVHRLMAQYAARGYNTKEIAELTDYTEVAVSHILRKPAAHQAIADEVQRFVSEDTKVLNLIKANVVASVETLAEIVRNDNGKERAADRIHAAEVLLDRRYGKANQRINDGSSTNLNDVEDGELARLLEN